MTIGTMKPSAPNIIAKLEARLKDSAWAYAFPQVREALSGLLSAEGHHCETAGHAAEGIHRFRERRFDIVIADKAMPGMSGDQMALSIKSIAPSVPFVLLTGFGSFLRGTELPGVDVVASKPITRAGLREAIEKALAAA